jgi:uncharacterized OsmC-like protein
MESPYAICLEVKKVTKLNATAKLVENYRIDVDDGRYHAVCLDIDQDSGGSDMGPSGLELALMSLVGCYATIMMLTASKMRATVSDLEVKGTATKTQEAGTIIEAKLEIAIKSKIEFTDYTNSL